MSAEEDASATAAGDAALREIADSLRVLVEEHRVLITMRRLELAERRLAPQRNDLRDARDDVRAIEDEIAHLVGVSDAYRVQIGEAVAEGGDPASERAELSQIEAMIEIQRERLEGAERRVLDAESDLDLAHRDVDRIEALLDELLEALEE